VIVEIKYCRDTRREDQEQRATEQHTRLLQAIKTHDPKADVQYCTLMLGVGGVIYTDFCQKMEGLGVTGPQLHKLAKKLHFMGIEELGKVWKCRRAMLNNHQTMLRLGPTPGRRPQKREARGSTPTQDYRKAKGLTPTQYRPQGHPSRCPTRAWEGW
jgi:hypothetical protein